MHMRKLNFNQIMRKDYKSYIHDMGKLGLAIIRGTVEDFDEMTRTDHFVSDVLGFLKVDKCDVVSVGCYAKKKRRLILFAADENNLKVSNLKVIAQSFRDQK